MEPLATDAIVLRAVPYGDSDLIVTLFSREHGRISGLARGARASKRRFAGALGLLTVSRVQLRARPRSELWTLSAAEPIRVYADLAADVAALAHASYGTELVRELTAAEQPDEAVFSLLVELYETLRQVGPVPAVLRAFELRLLDALGLAPVLDACIGCGAAAAAELDRDGAVLDPNRGGVACARCAADSRGLGVKMLAGGARRLLLAARAAPSLLAAAPIEASPLDARQARDAILALLHGHLGKPLRSLEFIGKLGRRGGD